MLGSPVDFVPKLLVIDASTLIHRILRARLKEEGIEIHAATDGHAGLQLARRLLPDVILIDLEIPGLPGLELLQALKNDSATNEIPVIFLSGSERTEDKVRALEFGAVDFITKPFDVPELRARVRCALRLISLVRLLAQRASIDGLTGLNNRTYFTQRLNSEFSEALRHTRPLSLIMCDIDKFKNINDTKGHPFGDQVIEAFARILSNGRAGDIACRYGGEEFVILLPTTAAIDGQLVAERMRTALEVTTWPQYPGLVVTASFGVADLESVSQIDRPEPLIEAADRALYVAKHGGRNQVALARSTCSAA